MTENNNCGSVIPKELEINAVKWCKQALPGAWQNIDKNDIQITQLSGGLSSLLYICSLKPHKVTDDIANHDPSTVLLRIYSDMAHNTSGFIQHNTLVSVTMAERDMGPRIYAFFPAARIEQFIWAKTIRYEDMHDPHVSALIARKLASFHRMDMPLPKEPKWLFKYIKYLIKTTQSYLRPTNQYSQHKSDLIHRLLAYDFDDLFDFVREIISNVPSPVVFCHNDLQRGNIFHKPDETDADKRIMFIDFEFSHYNWRGMDWGNHFCEWCWDYTYDSPPYFKFLPENYPTYQQKENFIRAYMSAPGVLECHLTDGAMKDLCIEVDAFALAACLLWSVWSIVMAFTSDIKFGYLEHAITRLQLYERLKERFRE